MVYNIYGRTRVFSDRVAALTLGAITNENPLRLKTIALAERIIEFNGDLTGDFAARGEMERRAVVCFNGVPEYLYMELPGFWNDMSSLSPVEIINQAFDRNLRKFGITGRPAALSGLLG